MPLTYKSENHEHISSLVRRFAFDSPKSSVVYPENTFFLVSGWCVPANPTDMVSVFVEYTDRPTEKFALSVHRPDVVSSLKIDTAHYSNKNFGFEIKVETKNLKSIGFTINSKTPIEIWIYNDTNKAPEQENKKKDSPKHINFEISEKFSDSFLKIFSHQKNLLSKDINELNNTLATGEEYFSKIKINTVKLDLTEDYLDKEISAFVRRIYIETSKNEWNTEAIKRLHQGGSFFIFSNEAKVHNNFMADDISYLLLSIGNSFFYFVQYCGNIGVFFPNIQTFISFTSIESWALICTGKLKKILHLTLKKFIFNNFKLMECKFAGAVLAQTRPYHFFYDGLYCLAHIALDGSIKTPIHLKSIKERCFMDVSTIFSTEKFTFDSLSENSFNEKQCTENHEFFILACSQYYHSRNEEIISYLDNKIVVASEHSKLRNSHLLEGVFKNPGFVLWIGISSEKRKMDNIVTNIKKVIENIKFKKNIRLTICFDGRTLPLQPSEQDRSFAHSETALIREIKSGLPEDIVFLNLAGLPSIDKIYIANKIDYFFCSFATDSLYVSRICKKKGFAYYPANAEAALGMHIHPNAELVKCITDQKSIGASWHTSSSIIDWDLLSSRIQNHILN